MQEFLLGSWGTQIVAYTSRYPWQVFAAVLVVSLVLVDLFRKNRSGTGADLDLGGIDCGGDGDGGD